MMDTSEPSAFMIPASSTAMYPLPTTTVFLEDMRKTRGSGENVRSDTDITGMVCGLTLEDLPTQRIHHWKFRTQNLCRCEMWTCVSTHTVHTQIHMVTWYGGNNGLGSRGNEDMLRCELRSINSHLFGTSELGMTSYILHMVLGIQTLTVYILSNPPPSFLNIPSQDC